jgi:arginine-tRNA-protein transferase
VNAIHEKDKDEDDKSGFKRWLCSNNLHYEEKISAVNAEKVLKMGAYHMNYYLDGKLIGVGVMDVLDIGMSTVYYFFDPKFKPLKFGVVSALYEIQWIRDQMAFFPEFRYYYLGFFIHNCDKMSYKSDYEPV